jgi:hypothetical protein
LIIISSCDATRVSAPTPCPWPAGAAGAASSSRTQLAQARVACCKCQLRRAEPLFGDKRRAARAAARQLGAAQLAQLASTGSPLIPRREACQLRRLNNTRASVMRVFMSVPAPWLQL